MIDHSKLDPILEMYLFENSALLEQLEVVILECEQMNAYPATAIHEIFRIMHTIKGSSTMMQFDHIAALSHAMEDLFAYLREREPALPDYSRLSELVLEGGDFIKVELLKLKNDHAADEDSSDLVSRITSYLEQLKSDGDSSNSTRSETAESDAAGLPIPPNGFKAVAFFGDDVGMESVRAVQLIQSVTELETDFSYYPHEWLYESAGAEHIRSNGFQLCFPSKQNADTLRQCIQDAYGVTSLHFYESDAADPAQSPSPLSPPASEKEPATAEAVEVSGSRTEPESKGSVETARAAAPERSSSAAQQASYLSVNVNKLDELMDLIGELVIAEAMVTQHPELRGQQLEQFQLAARHLTKITKEIQDKAMSIRMVPLESSFQKMNRVVRDMSKKLAKDIRLQLIGEETEVDKSVIDKITDPLMHLVRNAADHGLETGDEREAAGKPRTGTLTLEARNTGSEVIIMVRDDGRGMNRDKLLKRARENKLLYRNEADMSDREVYQLIFLPGFSTKDSISEFSGRGVGMDVVMKNIESIGGTVSVDSDPGRGSAITIKIPLTLAIIDGMNVKVGSSCFTLPITSIKESFRPQREQIMVDPDGSEMIMVRGQCYSIVRLHERFNLHSDVTDVDHGILTMVEIDGQHVCLFADELLGQQQVVVKALPQYIKRLRNLTGIAGCTLLSDGSTSLILDIPHLITK
ncbi:chemotaxis protein CheA [Paenibacillus turpanensis]|uniref:chemotaxis protein CheA n=1 Tax=Paenibacillus turpanensis TaxID=2689078 RepID=UPI00140B4C2B|nr:chemotaxis protein CheA [Paenibacillus turpanensis]